MKNKKLEERLVENLKDIKEIFDKYNIQYWLDWGTLLGAIRDKKIIEWDKEIDLGVREYDFKKINLIISEIEEKGFVVIRPPISASEFTFRRYGYGLDIWQYSTETNNLLATSYYALLENRMAHLLWFLWRVLGSEYTKFDLPKKGLKFIITNFIKYLLFLFPHKVKNLLKIIIRKKLINNNHIIRKQALVPKHYLDKFKTIKFYNMTCIVPLNSEAYLEYKYGKTWKVPIKKWDPWKEDGAVKSKKYEKKK